MATEHKVTRTTSIQGRAVTQTITVSGEVSHSLSFAIVTATVDELIEIAFAVAKLKSIIIKTDQDVMLETNDGTTPQETINLTAAMALQWVSGEEGAIPFSGDITAFYFSNSSGETANIEIEALYDEVV